MATEHADLLLLQQLTAHEMDELLTATATTTELDVPVDKSDDKRSRRTEIERLSRRRRQTSLQAQRAQLKQLDAQFAALLAGHARRQQRGKLSKERRTLAATTPPLVMKHETQVSRERFVELSLEIERLNATQKRLHKMLRAKHLMAFSVQSLMAACVDEWHDAIPRPIAVVDLEYAPLRVDEYFALLRDAYAEVLGFEVLLARDHDVDKACMGWRHRLHLHAQFALSSLTKSFQGRRDGESLMHDTWGLLSSEQRLKQVFSDWSGGIRCRVLYALTEDAVVLYRTFERRHVAKRFHSIVLLYRVQTDDGFAIGTRTIPTPAVQDVLQLPDKWVTICEWIRFRHVRVSTGDQDESAVEVAFGVGHPTPLPVPRWRLTTNFFTTVLRWEGALATPMALTWS